MTDDMVRWLGEQLDEDERTARAASPGPWSAGEECDEVVAVDGITVAEGFALSGRQLRATIDHIAEHDPARVLREINAKRQMLKLHGLVHRDISWLEDGEEGSAEIAVCSNCVPRHAAYSHRHDVPAGPCTTVRSLALPYADRPGHREEWRP